MNLEEIKRHINTKGVGNELEDYMIDNILHESVLNSLYELDLGSLVDVMNSIAEPRAGNDYTEIVQKIIDQRL